MGRAPTVHLHMGGDLAARCYTGMTRPCFCGVKWARFECYLEFEDLAPHLGHVSNLCGVKFGRSNHPNSFDPQCIRMRFCILSKLGKQPGQVSNWRHQVPNCRQNQNLYTNAAHLSPQAAT